MLIRPLSGDLSSLRVLSQFHPHHLTAPSPWPILTASSVLAMLTGFVLWFNSLEYGGFLATLGIITTAVAWILWFRDITNEGTHLGLHTRIVQHSLSLGIGLFILTEACFFGSIFWAYGWSSMSPTVELGSQWPPVGVTPLSPITVPLLNTILLVSSGATVTYAHHALFRGDRTAALTGTFLTVILAIVFTYLQYLEYSTAGFNMSDGAFGTCFYFSTGGHGMHVIIGTIFITVGLIRLTLYHFTTAHHMGYEGSILYWHFVDAVWLFLYAVIYWWGS